MEKQNWKSAVFTYLHTHKFTGRVLKVDLVAFIYHTHIF